VVKNQINFYALRSSARLQSVRNHLFTLPSVCGVFSSVGGMKEGWRFYCLAKIFGKSFSDFRLQRYEIELFVRNPVGRF
jgi:hypothetical protein